MGDYDMIFKRKSFHIFRNTEEMPAGELEQLSAFIRSAAPLDKNIETLIRIVPASETSCKNGAQYCILFYSQKAEHALANIGYIGEKIDLYCASRNIGTLWLGLGKPEKAQMNGLDFVIMMAIAKVPENTFRKDMFKSKRKPLAEIWSGETLGVGEIARFAPSACNSQPWRVENKVDALRVFRNKRSGRVGIIPVARVGYYNGIDMGIFLLILEVCLAEKGFSFERTLFAESACDAGERILKAEYRLR